MRASKQYNTGLIVGKFLPLHIGHESLIHTAIGKCNKLIILRYTDKKLKGYDTNIIKSMYPMVRFIDVSKIAPDDDAPPEAHREFCADTLLNELETTVQAVFTGDDYGKDFAEHLEKYFSFSLKGEHKVAWEKVDRSAIPISGTQLRENPDLANEWISYKARKIPAPTIALIGPECSGKTETAKALGELLKTRVVMEFGRKLQEQRKGVLYYEDMWAIATRQMELEAFVRPDPGKFLICDTTPLVTRWFSHHMFERVDPRLEKVARERTYNFTFICGIDGIPFEQDGYRLSEEVRKQALDWYRYNTHFPIIQGAPEERAAEIVSRIKYALDSENK